MRSERSVRRLLRMAAISLASLYSTTSSAQTNGEPFETWTVAVVVYDGVEILDFAGPAEVFQKASRIKVNGLSAFEVLMVGPTEEAVTSMEVLHIVPEHSIINCPEPDLLVLPGGRTERIVEDEVFMDWVKRTTPKTEHTMSVCTGIFMLAENGLLDGMEATTYWRLVGAIPSIAPKANALEDVRFTDNGQILTTAGVSAGIDGSLHLVARRLGYYPALMISRMMEYDWEPELRDVQGYVPYRHDFDARTWWQMGYSLRSLGHMDAAIDALERACAKGSASRQRRAYYDMAALHAHLGDPEAALETLGRAIDAGPIPAAWLERDRDFDSVRRDPRFIALVERIKDAAGVDGSDSVAPGPVLAPKNPETDLSARKGVRCETVRKFRAWGSPGRGKPCAGRMHIRPARADDVRVHGPD